MALEVITRLGLEAAVKAIDQEVIGGSVTGVRLDYYVVDCPGGSRCITVVYEKHYYRAGNRLTLTVIADDVTGKTRIHTIGGGGGQGIMRFDWGASKSFEEAVLSALGDTLLP